ncbi:MAG: 4Fe-4S binding protein [Oscillospiraceae bacterium]|nr:4Fe-4S binding protein [Oscillospiraceae bacterium]
MNKQKVIQLIFSPTGTTKKIADEICKGICEKFTTIDLYFEIEKQTIESNVLIIAAIPVYGGRVPHIAVERIMKLNTAGNQAVAIVVYGNRAYDDALLELKDTLDMIGCKVIAGGAFVAEHSMIREIAAGRPDRNDIETAFNFGKKIADKLNCNDTKEITVPGNSGYKDKKPANGMTPKTNKACIACGKCAKVCPVGAILADDPKKLPKIVLAV